MGVRAVGLLSMGWHSGVGCGTIRKQVRSEWPGSAHHRARVHSGAAPNPNHRHSVHILGKVLQDLGIWPRPSAQYERGHGSAGSCSAASPRDRRVPADEEAPDPQQ
jgi:hypothetical protein